MRFLLVEDDVALAKSLERGLREQAYAVDVATDGEDAFYKASINPYDAIILDVNLPKIDGFEVLRPALHHALELLAGERDVHHRQT